MSKKLILFLILFFNLAALIYLQSRSHCPLGKIANLKERGVTRENNREPLDYAVILQDGLSLLKQRQDKAALLMAEKILFEQPANLDALWMKAEIARRARDYQLAEERLNSIMQINSNHAATLISLAYIRYKDDRLKEAQDLVRRVFSLACADKEDLALANLIFGMINSRRSLSGGLYSKVWYGRKIKAYFLKAKKLAPDLPEVRLGLGTFYLLAPAIVGGNLDKAGAELESALELAPDFATVNARLAQFYQKKGDRKNCEFYLQRAKTLDPQNEALKEIDN